MSCLILSCLKSIEVVLSQHDYDIQNFELIKDYETKISQNFKNSIGYIKYIKKNT